MTYFDDKVLCRTGFTIKRGTEIESRSKAQNTLSENYLYDFDHQRQYIDMMISRYTHYGNT